MRISDQQLTFSSEYRQQQLQLRQQTTLPGQALPLSELSLRGEQVRYEETGLSTLSATKAPSQSDTAVTPEQVASQAEDERLLSRRDLLRQARQADEGAVRAAPSATERTAAPAVDGQLEFYRQASQWLDQLSATDTPSRPEQSAATETATQQQEMSLDSQTRILKTLLEKVMGIKVQLAALPNSQDAAAETTADNAATASRAPSEAAAQPDQAVLVSDLYYQQEQLAFVAKGQVTTSDGRQLQLDLGFALNFEQTQWSERLTRSSALKDPLVLNLDGLVAGFTSARFDFDLDADGQSESLAQLDSGSAFLALDRNGNGQIDDGTELFGARSGDGFAELASLDQDGNGVLDEADASFATLRLYRPGEALLTLGEQQIGAIFLQTANTPFQHLGGIDSGSGQSPAVLRQTGVYLTEEGKAGTLQQIDLRV